MKSAWTFSFFLGLFAWAYIPTAFAQETSSNLTRCENSFGKEPVGTTVEICRLELTGPVTQAKRVKILETLGKAYLAQNEADLASKSVPKSIIPLNS